MITRKDHTPPGYGTPAQANITPPVEPRCSCDATGAPEFPHRDWCELNHPYHPCDDRSCRFAGEGGER